jgi:hypothetical protein
MVSAIPSPRGTNLLGVRNHPWYCRNRHLYELDASYKINASVEFEITRDQPTYSFNISARRSKGSVAFLDISIRSYKWSPEDPDPMITVTIGRTLQHVTRDHLSITNQHGSPVSADMEVRVSCSDLVSE